MDYMDDTRLGKINDKIKKEESYFYYISVARGKGICNKSLYIRRSYPSI